MALLSVELLAFQDASKHENICVQSADFELFCFVVLEAGCTHSLLHAKLVL